MCGARMILPKSFTFSPRDLSVSGQPFASGSSGDVYQGSLRDSRVCVKRIRISRGDEFQRNQKVDHFRHFTPTTDESPRRFFKRL